MRIPADPPGEGRRVYCTLAGSFAAAMPLVQVLHFHLLTARGTHQTLYGGTWDALWLGLILGPVVAAPYAGPPTAVYFLCRPPAHRLRTRRGWATLCAGGAAGPACCLVADALTITGWGAVLLPATAVGLCAAAAAGLSGPAGGP